MIVKHNCVDCVSCSKIFLRAGNNPVVLENSTEHAEPLFIALTNDSETIYKESSQALIGPQNEVKHEIKAFQDYHY